MGTSLTLEEAQSITELPCACQQHRGKIKLGTRKKKPPSNTREITSYKSRNRQGKTKTSWYSG